MGTNGHSVRMALGFEYEGEIKKEVERRQKQQLGEQCMKVVLSMEEYFHQSEDC